MSAVLSHWLGDQEAKPAPGPLRRIQALINTVDRESGQDRMAKTSDAAPWLIDNDLLAADGGLSTDDLAEVIEVREALRAMIIHNADGPIPTPQALAPLRR